MRIVMQFLLAALAICASTSLAGESTIPEDKAVIPFETKLGIVTFQHRMHADLSMTECNTCHHTWEGTGPVKACHECHEKKGSEAPVARKIFHARCIGCHEYTAAEGMQAGPLKKKCKLCHIKPAE